MGTILIILGILCLPFSVNSPLYIAFAIGFIIWGFSLKGKKAEAEERRKNPRTNYDGGGSMRTAGDSYIGVYDDDGNFINVRDGGFTQGLDGRWRDNDGHVVDQDDDGEFHMY